MQRTATPISGIGIHAGLWLLGGIARIMVHLQITSTNDQTVRISPRHRVSVSFFALTLTTCSATPSARRRRRRLDSRSAEPPLANPRNPRCDSTHPCSRVLGE